MSLSLKNLAYVPESKNDFIFSFILEDMGVVFIIILILIICLIIYKLLLKK